MAEILLGRVLGPGGFERPVAMKRILPHLAQDRAFIDMFMHEARIAASIRHARVVQVHELAAFDREYFLVMEYVEGESLGGLMRRLWLRGESFDRGLAAHIIAEAAAGLHAAHELTDAAGLVREVVHRDVSPHNVMITYAGEVKVLDFGIAKASDSSRTQTGQVKGKCEYMSPEQCRGEPLDRRSDIFSLGILLYELTLGKRLFKREHAMLAFDAVCHAAIPRPSEIDPGYPRVLESICARALARDRRDRYASMVEIRRDLVAAIRSISGAEQPASEEQRIATTMARLFADRIGDKRDMLRRARTDSIVEPIPVAEVDAQVELPDVSPGAHAELAGTRSRRVRARQRRRLTIATSAVCAAVLGGAILWLVDPETETPASAASGPDPVPRADHSTASVAPVQTPAPLPRQNATADKPANVSLIVESVPPGADVFLGGERRGRTPCSIDVARADDAVAVTVSRRGFPPVVERVVPDSDQKLVVHLGPLGTPSAKRSPRPQSAKPAPRDKVPVFDKFD